MCFFIIIAPFLPLWCLCFLFLRCTSFPPCFWMHLHVHFFHLFTCYSLFACLFPHKDSVILLLLLLLLCLGGCCFHYCCMLLHAAHILCTNNEQKDPISSTQFPQKVIWAMFLTPLSILLSLAVIFCWPGFYDVVGHFFGANSLQLLGNLKECFCLCLYLC